MRVQAMCGGIGHALRGAEEINAIPFACAQGAQLIDEVDAGDTLGEAHAQQTAGQHHARAVRRDEVGLAHDVEQVRVILRAHNARGIRGEDMVRHPGEDERFDAFQRFRHGQRIDRHIQ